MQGFKMYVCISVYEEFKSVGRAGQNQISTLTLSIVWFYKSLPVLCDGSIVDEASAGEAARRRIYRKAKDQLVMSWSGEWAGIWATEAPKSEARSLTRLFLYDLCRADVLFCFLLKHTLLQKADTEAE